MVIKINPKERLSITGFPKPFERYFVSDPKANDPTVYEPVVYKCIDCNEEVVFEEKHFKKHSGSHFSNLVIEVQKEINVFLKSNNLAPASFLDFYCPKCKKPVSIFYTDGYGGRHGEYIVDIEFVLEIKKAE